MIYLDPKKLEARQLAPVDVVKALDLGNLMVTPGTAYFGDSQIALETNVMVEEVSELNEMPIRVGDGPQVLLRDIGQAEDASVIQKSRVRVNGRREVYVPIYRQAGPAASPSSITSTRKSPACRNSCRRGVSSASSSTRPSTSARPSRACCTKGPSARCSSRS